VATIIRGDPEAAVALLEEDQLAIYREVVRGFFRPTRGQARWIDAAPLAHRRDGDSASVADPGRAAEIVETVGLERVCSAAGPDDDCAGRPGGTIRLSVPYRESDGSAVIFATYTPGPPRVAKHEPSPFELEFHLAARERAWRIIAHRSLESRPQ
jgi:hypothetical protein